MHQLRTFFALAQDAVSTIENFVSRADLKEYIRADHLCFKCGSHEEYQELIGILLPTNKYVYQSVIAGRPIALVGIADPIPTSFGLIKYLEVGDQKPDNSQTSGFDHVEVLPVSISYEELVAHIQGAGIEIVEKIRPHHVTHNIEVGDGLKLLLTRELLVEKIRREEFI